MFRTILGTPRHISLLVHFLNAITRPAAPIVEATILNPYNEKEFLTARLTIVILELSKWRPPDGLDDKARWLYFFREAKHREELPAMVDSPERREAKSVLREFSGKERAYHEYQARLDDQRMRIALRNEAEAAQEAQARAEADLRRMEQKVQVEHDAAERARKELEEIQARAQQAQAEIERLSQLLRAAGIKTTAQS